LAILVSIIATSSSIWCMNIFCRARQGFSDEVSSN
jgi:hypothetical protein